MQNKDLTFRVFNLLLCRRGDAAVADAAAGAAHVAARRGEVGIRLVRPRAAGRRALAEELLLQLGVPVVLDVDVSLPRS